MNLFILGNGFDVAHKVESKYSDFKKFLEEYNPEIEESDMPDINVYVENGKLCCDRKNAANIIWHLINSAEQKIEEAINGGTVEEIVEWNHVEAAMGELDYSACYNSYFGGWNDEEDRPDTEAEFALKNHQHSLQVAVAVLQIGDFFNAWVDQIDIKSKSIKKDFKEYVKEEDIFINFNYTEILEKLYHFKNVYHIHGKKGSQKLVFGHGNRNFPYEEYEDILYGSSYILGNIH